VKPFTRLAVVIFILIAVLQFVRVVSGWEVMLNDKMVAPWVSVVACIVAAGMAVMVWRENRR
jgi:hypothetical protein